MQCLQGEDIGQRAFFALRVPQHVLREQPSLQVVRCLFALLFQLSDLFATGIESLGQLLQTVFRALLHAVQFSLHELTLADELCILFGREVVVETARVADELGGLHFLAVGLHFLLCFAHQVGVVVAQLLVVVRRFERLNLSVQGRDGLLLLLEVAVGLLRVVDRRHEPWPVVASGQQS